MVDHHDEIYNSYVESLNRNHKWIHPFLSKETQFHLIVSHSHISDVQVEIAP